MYYIWVENDVLEEPFLAGASKTLKDAKAFRDQLMKLHKGNVAYVETSEVEYEQD